MAIREIIESRFPSHGFYGEETGSRDMDAESLWLVDPIDGTKAFVREYAMFSTQIALMRGGEVVLGVSSAPAYGELAFAERGRGAYLNGKVLGVSQASAIEAAALSSGNLKSLATSSKWGRYGALISRLGRVRGQNRRLYRIGREYSRYRGVRGDSHGSRRPVHGLERRAAVARFDLRARHQRPPACVAAGGARLITLLTTGARASEFPRQWLGR
jgi:hypothetical protein